MMTPTLTVQQLIDALLEVPDKSALVAIEGCECVGDAGSVELLRGDTVMINRTVHDTGADQSPVGAVKTPPVL